MSLVDSLKKIGNRVSHSFPASSYLSLDPIAIDISPDAVRVVKLERKSRGYFPKVYKQVKFKRIHGLSSDSISPEDREDILKVLQRLKKQLKLKYVVVSLPEEKNYIYRTDLPYESITDIASAIRYGLEEHVPLSVDDVNFDYDILNIKGKKLDVVVSVFPKSFIKIYTDILKEAGLFPLSFQSESVALSNAVIKEGDKDLYLVIRMMRDRVNVSVTEGGAVQYTSTIHISGDEVSGDINSSAAKELSQELNKVLIYWFTSRKDAKEQHKIEKGVIVGSQAMTSNLVDFLEDNLKIDIEIGNVWANCFNSEKYTPSIPQENALDYAVANGLALKAVKYK